VSNVPDDKIPIGKSYLLCPECKSRINIFKGFPIGALVENLTGVRFFAEAEGLSDRHCEPRELWRVVDVIQPCPDMGKGRTCERENRGRCPNQRIILRLHKDRNTSLFKTCLYRKGRRIFDKAGRTPVGKTNPTISGENDEEDTRNSR
jgi:hypothetical protein